MTIGEKLEILYQAGWRPTVDKHYPAEPMILENGEVKFICKQCGREEIYSHDGECSVIDELTEGGTAETFLVP